MSNALQNRLVGTVILVAVIVIFLPDYLDGKKETNNQAFVDFPRSTSNLDASEPDPFPAEKVANATRRDVVIVDDGAVSANNDDQASSSNSDEVSDTPNLSAKDEADDQRSNTEESVSTEANAADAVSEEQKAMAARLAQNVKAAQNKVQNTPEENTAATDNSLAQQTIAQDKPSAAPVDSGWVVQLGSFGNQKNVNELLNKLEKAGYRTFSRKVTTSAGQLTKVFVGPELERDKLDMALPHLKETTGLTGKVTTFDLATK